MYRQGSPLVRRRYHLVKRLMDVGVCLAVLPLAVPLIAICGAIHWIESPGAFLYVQFRTGRAGKRFRMFKLRTMVQDADQLKQQLGELNQLTWPDFKIADDPRVTRVGRFLRKTSLDELPQVYNVLIGDMSLVGPRPTSFSADTYSLTQTERLEVKPGITGLWQVSGRSDVDFEERARLDVEYIERQSLSLDVAILLRTALEVVRPRGAY